MNDLLLVDWGLIGAGLGLVGVNGWNLWRTHGHWKAAEDAHRRAREAADPSGLTLSFAFGTGTTGDADAAEDPGVSEIPDLIEPIVGWRCWRVYNDGSLAALNAGSYGPEVWPPREAKQATCHKSTYLNPLAGRRDHTNGPRESCSCGYYAAKLLSKAQWPESNYAYGRVAMWGKVIEHEGGFRGEYAYPIEVIIVAKSGHSVSNGELIDSPAWSVEQAEGIRLRMETMYGIPVRIGSDDAMRDEWAAQYLDIPLPPQVVPLLEAAK